PAGSGSRPPPEAPVQQQVAGPHARLGGLPQQVADHVAQRLALADVGQGHGEALALADDVGGGVGVEVAGAALGRAAVDLVRVVPVAAVVGDQVQVDGDRLPTAAQGVGQVALQGAVEAALQLVARREGSQEGVVGGLVAGGVEQGLAGGPQGGDAGGGVAEEGEQGGGGGLGAVVLEAEVLVAEVGGVGLDVLGGDGILCGVHSSLPG